MAIEIKVPSYVTDLDALDIHQQFLIAAARGLVDKIKQLIDNPNLDHNCFDQNGYTALHLATSRGNIEIIEILLGSHNIEPNTLDKLGRHPIEIAWKRGCRKTAETLYRGIRARFHEVPAEAGLWLFSQMIFSNKEDLFGHMHNLQKACKLPKNSCNQLSKSGLSKLNHESAYWLNGNY